MEDIVLKIKDVSKQYRLGLVGTGTLSHDLKRLWYLYRGKEDPYAKVGVVNDREKKGGDYVWALNNINLDIKRGEVIGIIGKNGAGKSTLLKLLSQVTGPTKGSIKVKGRIASLLEVGTGFHPELTGRENIFLNGAILGMTKEDIRRKENEIIDFSGCAKYIDTPVKRYSSGMKVRLGFAVAAHLEPEILVVDEVLAVGDLEFQKKCIGKMKDVSSTGRTVLFVSHNMNSIQNLCDRCILLKDGEIFYDGGVEETVQKYRELSENTDIGTKKAIRQRTVGKIAGGARFKKISTYNTNQENTNFFRKGDDVIFKIKIDPEEENLDEMFISISIYAQESNLNLASSGALDILKKLEEGNGTIEIKVENIDLRVGIYTVYFWLGNKATGVTYDALNYLTSPVRINITQDEKIGMDRNTSYIELNAKLV